MYEISKIITEEDLKYLFLGKKSKKREKEKEKNIKRIYKENYIIRRRKGEKKEKNIKVINKSRRAPRRKRKSKEKGIYIRIYREIKNRKRRKREKKNIIIICIIMDNIIVFIEEKVEKRRKIIIKYNINIIKIIIFNKIFGRCISDNLRVYIYYIRKILNKDGNVA